MIYLIFAMMGLLFALVTVALGGGWWAFLWVAAFIGAAMLVLSRKSDVKQRWYFN